MAYVLSLGHVDHVVPLVFRSNKKKKVESFWMLCRIVACVHEPSSATPFFLHRFQPLAVYLSHLRQHEFLAASSKASLSAWRS